MRFIKKKNLMEGEELLYVPQLSWFFTVKNLVLSLPFFLILFIAWILAGSCDCLSDWLIAGLDLTLAIRLLIRYVFIVGLVIVLLNFVYRILLYLNIEYGVTNKRLIIKKGIICVKTVEIPFDRIESIHCNQGIMGRICRYGTICVAGIGGQIPVFYMISRPYAFRRKIVDIIEKNKAITVVHGDMTQVKPGPERKPAAKPEPISRYGTFVRILPKTE